MNKIIWSIDFIKECFIGKHISRIIFADFQIKTPKLNMKSIKLLVCGFLLLSSQIVIGQKTDQSDLNQKKNIFKINLTALVFKNFSFQYERVIGPKTSVALGIGIMPKSKLPFADKIQEEYGDDPDVKRAIDQTQLGNFSLTPEIRFYLGKKQAPAGFYIAPFLRYAHSSFEGPYTFTPSDQQLHTANVTGTINSIGGGLLLGTQWNLGKRVTLDWWIAGPIIGSTKGTLSGTDPKGIPAQDRAGVKQDIDDFDPPGLDFSGTVGANQIDVDIKGTYYGLRAFGICLGFKF